MPDLRSKLPQVGTTIFSTMSALAAQHGAINLSQGFPDFDGDPLLQDLVAQHLRAGHNQYAPMPGLPALRERLAEKLNRSYGCALDPDSEICITAGATQAIFTAITALLHPGDEAILIEPAYDCYRPAIELCGAKPVVYELAAPDFRIDWARFAECLSPRTRLVIINTPHNPTGSIWQAEDMAALADLLENSQALVLSDEVYEHIIFDGQAHQSILRHPRLRERAVAVFSFGKSLHMTGWKLGYAVAPAELMREFRKVHQYNVFSVNTPMQHALADYLAGSRAYEALPDFYQNKRDHFAAAMQGSRFEALPSGGSYFQLYRYAGISQAADLDFARHLVAAWGVAAIPISVFYSSGRDEQVLRFCFAKKEATLDAAAERLRRV